MSRINYLAYYLTSNKETLPFKDKKDFAEKISTPLQILWMGNMGNMKKEYR
jgi:hypothetical protein